VIKNVLVLLFVSLILVACGCVTPAGGVRWHGNYPVKTPSKEIVSLASMPPAQYPAGGFEGT